MRTHGLDISGFVDNLLDEAPLLTYRRAQISPSDNLVTSTTLRPRTYGTTATYRY